MTDPALADHEPDPGEGAAPAAKTRVAILGGGPGGIAAAFWLTATPALRARYEVTVHTLGWRLGGKCASGRNMALGGRIEEHGLHVLMGCYQSAFRTIRACYAEWQPSPASPFKVWTDAVMPQWKVAAEQQNPGPGTPQWAPWNFELPELPGEPGDAEAIPDPGLQIERMAASLQAMLDAQLDPATAAALDYDAALTLLRRVATSAPSQLAEGAGFARQALEQLAARVRARIPNAGLAATSGPSTSTSSAAAWDAAGFPDPLSRRLILADLALSAGIGWIADLCGRGDAGYDALNAQDFRAWLGGHGATKATLDSAPLRALYDLTFAYRDGDGSSLDNGSLAAGVTFRFAMDLALGYRHAPFWKMNAGTGDALFTPLYQVLVARGVRIEFFHRVSAVELTPDRSRIGSIRIDRQAAIAGGDYRPFVVVGGLDCWPDQPLWQQLADGEALRAQGVDFEAAHDTTVAQSIDLLLGRDFDLVVLAVPPDVIRQVAPQLGSADAQWRTMIEQSASVATEAFQLWLAPGFANLGWTSDATIVSAYAERFDSWADMSQQLPREAWPAANAPRAIEYFCGCLPESALPADPRQDAQAWLAASIAGLWPAVAEPGGTLLPGTVISAYYRANEDGSERYVQTPAGSVQYRLPPGPPRFGNLYLAGDWTLTRFSGGCFESAIESGCLAATAITG
jgi:uncharacterized protein with NAD-binding domain and iron-sulfur cluster